MPRVVPAWVSYHTWNRRSERMAELWTRGVVGHVRAVLPAGAAVLDFGCGFFDVGLAIADRAGRVDGIDPDPHAAGTARARVAAAGLNGSVFDAADDVPVGSYDLIVANSVLQYLADEATLAVTLARFRDWLRPGGQGTVVVADLIPERYSKWLDAGRSLAVSARHGVLTAMTAYLAKAALNAGGGKLLRVAPGRFAELAEAAGFACERLPRNLTPSRQRYSCVLTARGS